MKKQKCNILKLMVIALVVFSFTNIQTAFAEEPNRLDGTRSDGFEEFMYLLDQREDLEYNGPPSIYDAGILLTRIGEIDKKTGAYDLDFWFWVEINEEDDPTDFTQSMPEFNFVNGVDDS